MGTESVREVENGGSNPEVTRIVMSEPELVNFTKEQLNRILSILYYP